MLPSRKDDAEAKLPMTLHETLQDMYQRSPYDVTTIESYEMDCLLKSLKGPGHHSLYTIHHAFQICQNFKEALLHCNHLVKDGYSFILLKNLDSGDDDAFKEKISKGNAYKDQFHIDDSLLQPGLYFDTRKQVKASEESLAGGWDLLNKKEAKTAKKILQRLTSASKSNPSRTLEVLQELYQHLWISLGTDIRDGTADIALTLSMIPLTNKEESRLMNIVMNALTHIAALEISRRSNQKSRRSVEILMIVEKLAAAGCDQSVYMENVIKAAMLALPNSQNYDQISQDTLNSLKNLNMFSSRSLLWLWRKGHIFHKVTTKDLNNALTVEDLLSNPPRFDDPSLPLVVDVGCGLGVTLLGLASYDDGRSNNKTFQLDLDWSKYNYLGSDLSLTAIHWATSQTLRRGISGKCQFLHTSTETLLEYLMKTTKTDNANVTFLLLQFPTPYRLQQDTEDLLEFSKEKIGSDEATTKKGTSGCNEKLPLGPHDPTFMANPTILKQMVGLLSANLRRDDDHIENSKHYLLLQSNCEDVALHLHDNLLDLGFQASDNIQSPRMTFDGLEVSSRTKSWLQNQQKMHRTADEEENIFRRAVGAQWSSKPLIPIRTETEASSEYQCTPVHRCLFYN